MTTDQRSGLHLLRSRAALRVARLAFAALGIAAMVYQYADGVLGRGFSAANFFSYFTVEGNILAAAVLIVAAVRDPVSQRWQAIRGAAVLYMVITGIVYAVLLADVDVQLTNQWVNIVLHRVVPIVMLVDWLVDPPAHAPSARVALSWLAFPLAYFAYSLIRGPHADFYPYPFLDPGPHGAGRVVLNAVVLAPCMALLALIIAWLAGRAARRRFTAAAGTSPR